MFEDRIFFKFKIFVGVGMIKDFFIDKIFIINVLV